ncbi:protein kinase domain-containing protein [Legionella sp. D16C41]|uniref:protein kinase domain-containing protein n=1 Tax=Legionella sp. D16C41 TaxID=3402688 RepID=UPI003AF4358B
MKNLTALETKNLINFFKSQTKTNVWEKGKLYTLNDKTSILFNYNVVRHKTKNGRDVRYEFISPHLVGEGSMGSVFDIQATLAIKKDKLHFKQYGYNGKSRVVKIQHHNYKRPLLTAITEYRLSQQANHLAIKEPVFNDNISYTVMEKLKGSELYNLIFDDIHQKRVLTLNERVELTYALLNALKTQVTDKNILHRDIKLENIFVDLTYPIKITIFDYGLSTSINNPDNKAVGTPGYAAPEIYEHGKQTPALDIFSMGQVLTLIWHADTGIFAKPCDLYYKAKNIKLDGIFADIDGLDAQSKQIITTLLTNMLKAESQERITIDTAISSFKPIYNQYAILPTKEQLAVETKVQLAKNQLASLTRDLDKLILYSQTLSASGQVSEANQLNKLHEKVKAKLIKLQASNCHAFSDKVDNYLKEALKKITSCEVRFSKYKEVTTLLTNLFTSINNVHAHFINHPKRENNPITHNNFLFFNRAHATTSRFNKEAFLSKTLKTIGCREQDEVEKANPLTSMPLAVF